MSTHIGKSDPTLGREVEKWLATKGLSTPTIDSLLKIEDGVKIANISRHVQEIMTTLGMNLKDDSLMDTPSRVAKMYVKELFWGLDSANFPKCTLVDNKFNYNNSFVLEQGITVSSTCEHHFVAIDGKAAVAYIPGAKVLGLSKLNRIVQYFCRRPQVQERLTEQIAETISFVTGSPDVAVFLDAAHFCVKTRGIQDANCSTTTLATRGRFATADSEVRREFLAIARSGK